MERTIQTPHDFVQRFIVFEESLHQLIGVLPVYRESARIIEVRVVCTSFYYLFEYKQKHNWLICVKYRRNQKKENVIIKKESFIIDNIPLDYPVIEDIPVKDKVIHL